MRRLLLACLLACLLAPAAPAWAHLMPAQQGTIHFVGDKAFVLVSLPVSAFGGDDDGDGLISREELRAHRAAFQQRASDGFRMRDGAAAASRLMMQLIADTHSQGEPNASHLVMMATYQFAGMPSAPRVECDLFGASEDERRLALVALREGESEPVVLTPLHRSHGFFLPAWRQAAAFAGLGIEHILTGLDHLLFLLTVLVAGAGWRYWAAVITSFTLAHSITLTLAALGWAALPPVWAEAMIAASIIGVALDNLRRGARVPLAQRSAIVFACGLVHGLGFAEALRELGGGGAALWVQLAGFNAGVELGQLLFVSLALGTLATAKRVWPVLTAGRIVRGTSWTAAGVAGVLLAQTLL
ncbi:MAG TPA: HupE/UreJ family protein [Ramlibacter sp.]|uniref:HupE/UreJ family protein n=1 Tax=Ramlibacter sp. TaxID=1917967 RepID=UPI002D01E76D|nr:HupE/UreJ family protein [Ramlibacter sp.]HVZ42697.1 HupE/UreJ family protein [Ramlibacter sp.]